MEEIPPDKVNRSTDRIGSDPFVDMDPLIEAAAAEDTPIGPDLAGALPQRIFKKSTVPRLNPDLNVSMVACPYLGIFDDAHTRFLEPEPAHRCYAGQRSRPIMLGYQGDFCLSPGYRSCEIYVSTRVAAPAAKPKKQKGRGFAFLRRLLRRDH